MRINQNRKNSILSDIMESFGKLFMFVLIVIGILVSIFVYAVYISYFQNMEARGKASRVHGLDGSVSYVINNNAKSEEEIRAELESEIRSEIEAEYKLREEIEEEVRKEYETPVSIEVSNP